MSGEMRNYYKDFDPLTGSTCLLTLVNCDEDCTKCVFAKEAYRQALKEKDERQDRMNSVDEIDRMIDFMKGMDIKAMQDVVQGNWSRGSTKSMDDAIWKWNCGEAVDVLRTELKNKEEEE